MFQGLQYRIFISIGADCFNGGIGNNEFITGLRVNDDGLSIQTYDSAKAAVDDVLLDTPIEIRVYP